jgi:glyoxylase-like metal-dependent hydrolase (beta-lactamase superfamily II)
LLANGDTVQIGQLTFDVIHLRGHTPGSIALALGGPATGQVTQLFTGDCLFPGGPGRTTTPEAFNSLMSGLEERVFGRLPDETWIYPGHGNDTNLGAERPHLAEWRARGW